MIGRGIIAGSFVVYGGSVLVLFLLELVLPKILSQADYSSWVFWRSLLFTLAALFPLGMDQANVRLAILESAETRSALVIHWIVGVLIMLGASTLLGIDSSTGILSVLVVGLIAILLVLGSEHRARLDVVKAQVFTHGWKALFAAFAFLWLSFSPLSYDVLLIILVGSSAVLVPVAISLFVRRNLPSPDPFGNRKRPRSVKEAYSVSVLFLISTVSLVSATYFEQILVGTFADVATVARFGVHITLYFLPSSLLVTFIGFMLSPYFRSLSSIESGKRLRQYVKVAVWLTPPLAVATYFIGSLVVEYVYERRYTVEPVAACMILAASIFRFFYVGVSSYAGMHLDSRELSQFAAFALVGTLLQAAFVAVAAQSDVDVMRMLAASVLAAWLFRTVIATYFVRRHLATDKAR